MPYEIKLENIDRTFYNISAQYMGLMNELPMDIIEFTMKILPVVQSKLDYDLNPNLVLTLADHLAFAMERERKKISATPTGGTNGQSISCEIKKK